MNKVKVLLLLIVGLALSGCGKTPSDEEAAPAAPQAEGQAPAIAAVGKEVETQNGPYALKVNPGQVFRCGGRDRTVATLDWNIDDPAVGDWVEVKVIGPGEAEAKTFTKGGRTGSAETGNWVFEGTRFSVVDPNSGKELVAYEVVGLPCQ